MKRNIILLAFMLNFVIVFKHGSISFQNNFVAYSQSWSSE